MSCRENVLSRGPRGGRPAAESDQPQSDPESAGDLLASRRLPVSHPEFSSSAGCMIEPNLPTTTHSMRRRERGELDAGTARDSCVARVCTAEPSQRQTRGTSPSTSHRNNGQRQTTTATSSNTHSTGARGKPCAVGFVARTACVVTHLRAMHSTHAAHCPRWHAAHAHAPPQHLEAHQDTAERD